MAIERSASLRLPNERPHIRVSRTSSAGLDQNANLREMGLDLASIGEAPCSSASAPTLNLAYFGPAVGRPTSLHQSKLDLDIENLSGTLERGSTDHRQMVSLPARYKMRLRNHSLATIFSNLGSPGDKGGKRQLQIQPPIEEGEVMSEVMSEDIKDREQDLNTAIKWLHQEILQMKKQDRALMRRLLELRAAIHQLAGGIQTSAHSLSTSMAALGQDHLYGLAADSWPLLGGSANQPESPDNAQQTRDMVEDFHKRQRAVSVVPVMPAGRAAQEVAATMNNLGRGGNWEQPRCNKDSDESLEST